MPPTDGDVSTDAKAGSDQPAPGTSSAGQAGSVSQADLDKANARARSFQSAADQANARADAIAAEVREMKGLMQSFDPNAIARTVQAGVVAAQAIEAERSTLKSEFPSASADVLNGSYTTPEELRQAVTASHTSEEQRIQALRDEITQQVRDDVKAKHGIDLAPQSPPADNAGTGQITLQDFEKMSFSERMELSDEDIERLSKG